MMRINSGIVCALSMSLAFAIACADSPGTGDDQTGDDTTNDVCGDGTCASAEIGYCPTDCGNGGNNNQNAVCGNGMCETTKGETASSCVSDCGNTGSTGGSNGSSSGSCPTDPNACIGCLLDPSMCPSGLDSNTCLTCILNGGGLGSGGGGSGFGDLLCTGGAPDGTCDSMEDSSTCPSDCP